MKQEMQTIVENWAEERSPSQYPQRTHADMAFSFVWGRGETPMVGYLLS